MNIQEMQIKINELGGLPVDLTKVIDINTYIPIMEKQEVAQTIATMCTSEEKGIIVANKAYEKLYTALQIITKYTNITLSDNIIEELDYLMGTGLYQAIISRIGEDVDELKEIIQQEINNQIISNNSIEAILVKSINKLIEKIPNEKSVNKFLNKISKMDLGSKIKSAIPKE